MAASGSGPGVDSRHGAASALTTGRMCSQVPVATLELLNAAVFANEAPTISPETVPHSNHQHLSSEFDC